MGRGTGRVGALLAVSAAAVLLGLATASAPVFVSAAGTAMLARELESGAGEGLDLVRIDAVGMLTADTIRSADQVLRRDLEQHGLPDAVLTLMADTVVVAPGDPPEAFGERLMLLGRQGATEHLPPTIADAEGSFAMPADSAARLPSPVDAGDELLIIGHEAPRVVTVGRLVEPFSRTDMPAFWQPVSGMLAGVEDDPRIGPPPPVAIGEPEDVLDALAPRVRPAEDDPDGPPAGAAAVLLFVTWTSTLEGTPTLEQARELIAQAAAIRSATFDPASGFSSTLAVDQVRPDVTGQTLDAAVGRVEGAVAALAVPVRLLGVGGAVLALVGVGVATSLGGRRRLARAPLWAARGVPPSAIGLRWSLEAAVPVTVGLAVGLVLSEVGMASLTPGGTIDASVRVTTLPWLAVVGVLAVVIVGVTAGVAAARGARRAVSSPRRPPPVAEALLAALAGLALWRSGGGGAVSSGADGVVRFDPLAVALPVLLVAAAAAVGSRLLSALLRHGAGRGGGRGAWYLASRRLRAIGGASLGLVTLTAVAIGLLTVASTLGASADATIEEQTGLLLGADAVLTLPRSDASAVDLTTLELPNTRVRSSQEGLVDGRVEVDVLIVDPDTFAEVAHRPQRVADVDVAETVARLTSSPGAGSDGEPMPAVWVGAPRASLDTLSIGPLSLDLTLVGDVPVFPGVSGQRPAVVLPDRGPLATDDVAAVARLAIALQPQAWVAADGLSVDRLRARLDLIELPSGGSGPGAVTGRGFLLAEDLRTDPGLAPATDTFRFLRGQATMLVLLVVAGLVAHLITRQRQQALASILAGRMGLSRRQLQVADLAEAGLLISVGALVGVTAGLLAARAVLPAYDPLPDVALPVVFAMPVQLLPGMGAAAGLGAMVTAVASRRAVARADVPSLLRSGT